MTQNDIADRLDALEAQLDDQQKTIDRQQERIEAQEAIINAQQKRLDADGGDADDSEEIDANGSDADGDDSERAVLNRRTALQAGGVLGLLGLGAGTASADASGQIGTSSDPLQQLYTEELNGGVTGDAQLTNIAGSNLSIDSSGNLNASGGGSGAWVEGDNTSLLEPVSKDGIEVDTIADNGSGSVTMNSALDLTDNQINYGTNAGSQTLANLPFGSDTAGTTNSYAMQLNGDDVLTINGVNDGSGNLNNAYVFTSKELRLAGTLNTQDGTIENTTGGLTITTNDNGNLTLDSGASNEVDVNGGDLDLNSNNINNAASIDNGGSAISVDDTLQLGGSKIKAGSGSSDVVIQADDGSNPGNILMGRSNNSIGSSIIGAVISGGGADGNINEVSADYGAVGGGKANVVKSLGSYGTIPGGIFCEVDGMYGFAVGYSCSATANYASALGGEDSHASAANATVAGGKGNTASADYAFVGGGRWNEAGGTTAFAAGAYAHAADNNSFVWNDGSGGSDSSGAFDDQFKSTTTAGSTPTGAETFSVKAKGGVRFITSGDNSSHAWVDTNGNIKASGNVDAQGGTVENTTGGLTIATATDQLLAFYGASPVTQQTGPSALSDSTGGNVSSDLAPISGSGDDSTINNNFASLASNLAEIRSALESYGLLGQQQNR